MSTPGPRRQSALRRSEGQRKRGTSTAPSMHVGAIYVDPIYFAATKGASSVESTTAFLAELADSSLAAGQVGPPTGVTGGWPDAFRVLGATLPDTPAVVVLDELPWLAEQDEVFDGALQTAWDRLWSRRPVLLVLLGSDLHMMERLTAYDRPFYGRADNLVLGPLNPAETGRALGLDAADAIDAHLVTGGLPGIIRSWPHAMPPADFLRRECDDPAAPLFGVPESSLLAEFPSPDQAHRVVESIGGDNRTHANIAATAGSNQGHIPSGTLSPLLRRLTQEKRVLAVDHPLSTKPGKPALYRIADSSLRFYLPIGRAIQEQARRGRPHIGARVLQRQWTSWRGRAVEPLIREALELAGQAGELPWPDTATVGGWWNRQHNPEIDLVGADHSPVAGRIDFAGSIKWIGSTFDRHDLETLRHSANHIPGYEPARSGLAVVSLSGTDIDTDDANLIWGPQEIMDCWKTG
ncbi:ATP-binding protein [Saccharothrix xinjiangensis]|uniref:ATP-binding protein n=2 Tax=Saccharothrix xinjiangensis TaxID=204798 RepID=A0ABV9YAQ0_9PSEU